MTQASTTTYDQLLERLITDGIAEVRVAYADPKDHHKRDGAIEGFEACRGKTPPQLVDLWREIEDQARQIKRDNIDDLSFMKLTFWKTRYKALQVEFILNVLSVDLNQPLLPHLPTYRGAVKYAQIVGVSSESEEM